MKYITEFEETYKGFKIKGIFTQMGYRCGYVDIPSTHPLYGEEDVSLICHGGIMYSKQAGYNTWRIGFDCAHSDDKADLVSLKAYGFDVKMYNLVHSVMSDLPDENIRSVDFVKNECKQIVEQLIQLEGTCKDATYA